MSPVFVEGMGAGSGALEEPSPPPDGTEPEAVELQAVEPEAVELEPSRLEPATESPAQPVEVRASTETPKVTLDPGSAQVRRMRYLESAAVLGTEEVIELLSLLEVQRGYLKMLDDEATERPDDRELVREALDARARMEQGLRRLLGWVREGVPARETVELNDALPAMIPALAREIGEGARLRVAPPIESLPVEADASLLQRALVHLVQNAREASLPGGSVRLSWGPAPEGRAGDVRWEGARIRVEDHGEGIPREHAPWLFEPFFSTRKEHHPLRGLGLPIVQAIVEGHGGWVEVCSRPGEGTEVDLFLPLAIRDVRREWTSSSVAQAVDEGPVAHVPRIVVLEDEPLLAKLLSQILSRAGFEVEVFETSESLERRRKKSGAAVHLLLAERKLPGGGSGAEVAREWQEREPGVPVVLIDRHQRGVSGRPDSDSDPGLPLLRPPFEPGEIVRRVRELLGSPPSATPPAHGTSSEPPSPEGPPLPH